MQCPDLRSVVPSPGCTTIASEPAARLTFSCVSDKRPSAESLFLASCIVRRPQWTRCLLKGSRRRRPPAVSSTRGLPWKWTKALTLAAGGVRSYRRSFPYDPRNHRPRRCPRFLLGCARLHLSLAAAAIVPPVLASVVPALLFPPAEGLRRHDTIDILATSHGKPLMCKPIPHNHT